jgi:hypothetical protein
MRIVFSEKNKGAEDKTAKGSEALERSYKSILEGLDSLKKDNEQLRDELRLLRKEMHSNEKSYGIIKEELQSAEIEEMKAKQSKRYYLHKITTIVLSNVMIPMSTCIGFFLGEARYLEAAALLGIQTMLSVVDSLASWAMMEHLTKKSDDVKKGAHKATRKTRSTTKVKPSLIETKQDEVKGPQPLIETKQEETKPPDHDAKQ